MPFTPYHFGPSGFIGLVFRKWLDVPVFILANVIVDIEVLVTMILGLGAPHHRYCHTLVGGAAVGLLWGVTAYPLRGLFKAVMRTLRVPYRPSLLKMVFSGILGAWLHVLIDGAYHPNVNVFWPIGTRSLWTAVMSRQMKTICIVCLVAAIVPYAIAVVSYFKTPRREGEPW